MNEHLLNSFRRVTLGLLALLASGGLLTTTGQTLASVRTPGLARQVTAPAATRDLRSLLTDLEQTYGVRFNYRLNVVREVRVVPAPLGEFGRELAARLNQVLAPAGLQCKALDARTFVIQRKITAPSAVPARFSEVPEASTQSAEDRPAEITVRGRVTGETGAGLPGVSVTLKGTTRGTVTTADGSFQIQVPDGSAVLVFSSVGYEKQEVTVGNQTTLTLTLRPDQRSLDEVVVVGYGTVKKSDLTGSVAKVGEAAIKAMPIASLDRAMQGRAAGVQVTQNSARPGGGSTIRIRGAGSVNASNDPLYVIDGFPTGNLNSINTDDIESIEILKDASATAIYGSRGSNGVVLVTTKRGKAGKAVVNYDGYYGVQSVRRTIPLLNARQFAEFVNEARVNGGARPYFDGSTPDQPLPETLGEGTDWQAAVLREAPIQNHQVGVNGGSETSRYAVSLGYFDQQGIVLNSRFKRYSLRTNLDNTLSAKFKLGLTFQGSFTQENNARTDVDGNGGGGVTSSALSYSPTFPRYNADGTYYKNLGAINGYSVDNPLAVANERTNRGQVIRLLANAYLDYAIAEGLTFRTSFGTDLLSTKINDYTTRLSLAGVGVGGSASVSSAQSFNWLNENTLNYTRQLGTRHTLSALLGYTIQGISMESVTANANTFANDFAAYNNLGAGSTLVAPSSGASEWRLISYLARVNYGFDDRFLLTFTARRDGSSRFGPKNKFGFFPSGALAWKVINETWLKNQSVLSDAKLRLSYGFSGNQEIGDYRFLATIANQTAVLGNTLTGGSFTGSIANPGLRWEKNAQFDVGLDLGLVKNRVQLTADYYIKTTSDLLFNVSVPSSSGFTSTLKNIGRVENRGIEFSLNTINVDRGGSAGGGFRWTSEFNLAFNQNRILALDGRREFTTGSDVQVFGIVLNPVLLRVGSPLGTFFGRVTDGIFQNQAEVDNSAQKAAKPGDLRYRDLNGDGTINDLDRAVIGNANPDFFGGFNNTFFYQNFDLNVFVQGSYGNDILNTGLFDLLNLTGGNNQSIRALERWTPTNPSTTVPRANGAAGSRIVSSFQVEDGSYLRFKVISFGYTFPRKLLNRRSISSLRVYAAAQNWITLTRYSGYDPEVNRYGSGSLGQGIDYGGYPAAKTLLLGLNLKL